MPQLQQLPGVQSGVGLEGRAPLITEVPEVPLAPMLALGLQPDLGSPAHAAGEHLLALHGVGKAGSEGGGRSEPTLNAASSIILVHQLEQMPSLGQLQPRLALGAARLGAALALAFALAATLAATTVYTATHSAAPTTAATTAYCKLGTSGV